mgnify:CR=1 FL=1
MTRIAIAGAAGRMGRRITALAAGDDRFQIAAALESAGCPDLGRDAGELAGLGPIGVRVSDRAAARFDVLIDFSLPAGTGQWLGECVTAGSAAVIGTTGHTAAQLAAIEQAAAAIPVLKSTNMSVGVNLLFALVEQAAAVLGDGWDVEIVETHHRFKKDAPSGTAMSLMEAVVRATGRDPEKDVVYGRHGQTGERPRRQIGMHALRVGDTVGEHEVHFGSLGETVTLRHSAHNRDIFAAGALRAAAWLKGRPAGLYDMRHVLGMR